MPHSRSHVAAGSLAPVLLALAAAGVGAQQELPPIEVVADEAALPAGLEQLPASVTRVERDALADAQYQVDLSEALARVPGLVANRRQNYAQDLQLSLRGFGARAAFGVRGLRLYTDGIPATMPDGQSQVSHFDLLGAERATVLRGPFSALYGASSGGVIELATREPADSSSEISTWRAADELQRHGWAGALARDAFSVLATASWLETAGYRAHSAARRGGGQVRGAFGADRRWTLIANVVDVEAQDPLGLTRQQWQTDPSQSGANAAAYDPRKTVRQSQAGLSWTPATGSAGALRAVTWAGTRATRQFLAIPDFVQGTLADNPTHPGGVIDLDRGYAGADIRWQRRAGPAQVSVGLDAEFLEERRLGFQNFVGTPGDASTKGVQGERRRDEDNAAQTWEPYAQIESPLTAAVTTFAGLRWSAARFTSRDRFVVEGNGDDSGAVEFESWLPVAGVRWSRGAWSAHAAASRGAETPTLNELAYRADGSAGLNGALRPSRSSNVEVGGRWDADLLAAELVVFGVDTRDEIVVAGSSGGRTTYRNAAGTRRDGLEASVEWRPWPDVAALAAYTLLDARYDAGVAGGNPLPGVPRHSLFAEVRWHAGFLRTSLEGLRRSAVTVDDLASDRAPAYTVFNLRITAALPAGVELMARVDNLLDETYVGSVIVNEQNGRFFEPAPGVGFGLGLRWSGAPR